MANYRRLNAKEVEVMKEALAAGKDVTGWYDNMIFKVWPGVDESIYTFMIAYRPADLPIDLYKYERL